MSQDYDVCTIQVVTSYISVHTTKPNIPSPPPLGNGQAKDGEHKVCTCTLHIEVSLTLSVWYVVYTDIFTQLSYVCTNYRNTDTTDESLPSSAMRGQSNVPSYAPSPLTFYRFVHIAGSYPYLCMCI